VQVIREAAGGSGTLERAVQAQFGATRRDHAAPASFRDVAAGCHARHWHIVQSRNTQTSQGSFYVSMPSPPMLASLKP
jgi:hypothetical protein